MAGLEAEDGEVVAVAQMEYTGADENQLSVAMGEKVVIEDKDASGWFRARNEAGVVGYVLRRQSVVDSSALRCRGIRGVKACGRLGGDV